MTSNVQIVARPQTRFISRIADKQKNFDDDDQITTYKLQQRHQHRAHDDTRQQWVDIAEENKKNFGRSRFASKVMWMKSRRQKTMGLQLFLFICVGAMTFHFTIIALFRRQIQSRLLSQSRKLQSTFSSQKSSTNLVNLQPFLRPLPHLRADSTSVVFQHSVSQNTPDFLSRTSTPTFFSMPDKLSDLSTDDYIAYGGLYLDFFENDGQKRVIYHNYALDENKITRPVLSKKRDVSGYYAFDDDKARSDYMFYYDNSTILDEKKCRRTNWHKLTPINCNSFHELDLATLTHFGEMSYLQSGSYRDVYLIELEKAERVVYKSFGSNANFDYADYEYMRMDCVVAERLSSSSFIADIYGFCGLGHLGEFMQHGALDSVAIPIGGRNVQRYLNLSIIQSLSDQAQPLTPLNALKPSEKLKYALQMAQAIAALHGFKDGVIVHDDIQPSQYLLTSDMQLKLNDFNRAEIMLWNDKDNEYCKYRNNPGNGDWRAPEEYFDDPLNEKIDIFSLGNNIYSLVTGLYPYHSEATDELDVQERIKRAQRPSVDIRWRLRTFAERKLLELVDQCWEFHPNKRIDIFHIVKFLENAVHDNEKLFRNEDKVYIPVLQEIVDKGKKLKLEMQARTKRQAKAEHSKVFRGNRETF